MSAATLDKCEKYYGTRDVYKLFGIPKDASNISVRKAFYQLSLQTHPDAASKSEKEEAIEKTELLQTLYNILVDQEARAKYNQHGVINKAMEDSINRMKERQMFGLGITTEDIDLYHQCYIGSPKERSDVKEAYLSGKGCLNYMMDSLPFVQCKDEPRLATIVQEMIDRKEVPEYEVFTKEPEAKRNRRHAKLAREAEMAKRIREEQQQGLSRAEYERKMQQESKNAFFSMIRSMEAMFQNQEEETVYDFDSNSYA